MKTNPRSQKRADPRVARTTENPNSARCGPDQVEQEFAETLRQAAYIFEKEENGRFQGSILACKAVVRFIHQRGGGAELAGPFLQIVAAFEERKRGGNPGSSRRNQLLKKKDSVHPSGNTFICSQLQL